MAQQDDERRSVRSGDLPNPPLVGRQTALDLLRRSLADVSSGDAGAIQITGLAGMGKTRLAREALALAADAGFRTATGRAHSFSSDLAYAPVVEALGPVLHALEPDEVQRVAGDLPQLGLLVSGLPLPPAVPLPDPAMERTRLIDAVARLVERLTRDRPLALLLDDLHLADTGTLDVLAYLAGACADRPLLLLTTQRSGIADPTRVATLAQSLVAAGWWRHEVVLEALTPEDAASLMQHMLGAPLAPPLLDAVARRCAGRPFLLEATARSLLEGGQLVGRDGHLSLDDEDLPVPSAVREQLRGRLAALTPCARHVLELLAATDRPLEHDLLLAAAQTTADDLAAASQVLQRRGLVTVADSIGDKGPTYELAHDLLRETVLDELTPAALRSRHHDLAGAMQQLDPDDARLADHVIAAGGLVPTEVALPTLMAAAERARSRGAMDRACRYLTAAAPMQAQLDGGAPLARCLSELAQAQRLSGLPDEACATWTRALTSSATSDDVHLSARLHRALGECLWDMGRLDESAAHLSAAEALLATEASAERAALLHSRVNMAVRTGDVAVAVSVAVQLRQLAERLGSPALVAQALLAEAVGDFLTTDYEQMSRRCERALEPARSSGAPLLVQRALDQLAVAAATQGDVPALRRYSEQGLAIVRQVGAVGLEPWPRSRIAMADLLGGDWDAALRGTTESVALCRRAGHTRGLVGLLGLHAWVLVHLGRLSEARRTLDEALTLAEPMLASDPNAFTLVALAQGAVDLADGDARSALEHTARLASWQSGWVPLLSALTLGEAQVASGAVEDARQLVARLRAVASCRTGLHEAAAGWVEGLQLARDGAAEASEVLAGAAELFDRMGLPFQAARARFAAATAVVDDSDRVTSLARTALETFESLGAAQWTQQAREVLRGLGVVPSRGRSRATTGTPLSARELEVARLVATGLSNAQVATRLFVSPRTVTTHLDRIYARLGVRSRVALTRYLADSGLLDDRGEDPTSPRQRRTTETTTT